MTKRILLLVCITASILVPLAAADIGAGIVVGEPTGLSFSYNNQFILGTAWSFRNYVHVHGDYLFLRQGLPELEERVRQTLRLVPRGRGEAPDIHRG